MKSEDLTITSVAAAIEALDNEDLMRDIQPERSAKGGDAAFGLWFRGHERVSYRLTPSVLRRPRGLADAFLDEVPLVRHFQTMNPDAVPAGATDFDRLVMMQHYQTPTRLLDWTENLLVALYFAVRNPAADGTEDAAVWMLNARRLNYHTSATTRTSLVAFPADPDVIARSCLVRVRSRPEWHDVLQRELRSRLFDREDYRHERITAAIAALGPAGLGGAALDDRCEALPDLRDFEVRQANRKVRIDLCDGSSWKTPAGIYSRLRMPVAVYAPRSNRRIASQSGVFTLHGGKLEPVARGNVHRTAIGLPVGIEDVEAAMRRTRVAKWLRIPAARRGDFRRSLARIGISDASLFPELEYQSRSLVERWTYERGSTAEAD